MSQKRDEMRQFLEEEGMDPNDILDFLNEFFQKQWNIKGRQLVRIDPPGKGSYPALNIKWVEMVKNGRYDIIPGQTSKGSVISSGNTRDVIAERIGKKIVDSSAILFAYGLAIEIWPKEPRIATGLANIVAAYYR
tara:strand:+ start:10213 stop:10617 length:405 start_codon:yes stop_codon:yes gene_type:complete